MLKFHPRTGHESPEGERKYCSTVSLTSALKGVVGECQAPAALPPGKVIGTHCIGGGWAPGPVWTGAKNLAPSGMLDSRVT